MTLINASPTVNDLLTRQPTMFLKWKNAVIGRIENDFTVRFVQPYYNAVTRSVLKSSSEWTRSQFIIAIGLIL